MAASDMAGCFHCGALFAPTEITEWIDEPAADDGSAPAVAQATAACPRCTMDAVLPSTAMPLSPELLARMAERYFGGRFGLRGPAPESNPGSAYTDGTVC